MYDSLSNRKISEQRSEKSEEVNHVKIQGKSISGRGNSKHNNLYDPGTVRNPVGLQQSKQGRKR